MSLPTEVENLKITTQQMTFQDLQNLLRRPSKLCQHSPFYVCRCNGDNAVADTYLRGGPDYPQQTADHFLPPRYIRCQDNATHSSA